ncbi:MAG: ASPIC/UnbV domain-containing protein [Planctomycetes bacterium]|nr:ASPIC/UnbV domain-containing protein [Planctomycetota bacterium]
MEDHRKLVPQKPFLYWNRGKEGFVDVAAASPALRQPFVARSGTQFDFDHDGRVDWVFVCHGGRASLLRNISDPTGRWLRVTLRQRVGNTSAIGARVFLTVGETTQMAEVGTASSYLSRHELTVHFGLGTHDAVDELRIVWPDGHEERHTAVPAAPRPSPARKGTPFRRSIRKVRPIW